LKLIATSILSTINNGFLFPIAAAKQVRSPALILHGDADAVVPVAEAYELYGCVTGSKR
jgi:fermentation-respiration switch protein FrsA (DUF1100 family)